MKMQIKHASVLLVASASLLILGTWLFTHTREIRAMAETYSLIPKEEHFTELYFEDSQILPRVYAPGKTQKLSFTIHNLEGKEMDYAYQVYFIPIELSSTSTPLLKVQSMHVPDGGSATKKIAYTLDGKIITKGTIVVRLPELSQEIHFTVTK